MNKTQTYTAAVPTRARIHLAYINERGMTQGLCGKVTSHLLMRRPGATVTCKACLAAAAKQD